LKIKNKFKKPKSLFNNLMFWFLLLSLVPQSITSLVNYQQTKQSLLTVTEDKLYQSSEASYQFINNWFSYRFVDINVQARGQVTSRLLEQISTGWSNSEKSLKNYVKSDDWLIKTEGLQDDLVNLSNNYDYIYDLFLIDMQGNILFTVKNKLYLGDNLINGALSESKFAQVAFETLNDGKTLFSDLERYSDSKELISGFLTAPVFDHAGEIIGVYAIQLRLDSIFERMIHQDDVNSSQRLYFVADDGLLRTPMLNDLATVLKQEIKTEQFKRWYSGNNNDTQNQVVNNVIFEYQGPAGNKVFGIHQLVVINNIDWVLISEIDSAEVFEASNKIAEVALIMLLFSIIIIGSIAFFLVKRITTPLQKLSEASHNVALGKGNQQVDIVVNNEIGQLANSFNNMLTKQQETELEISKSNQQLRDALSELSSQQYALDQHAIVAITDIAGTIVFVNDKFCEVSGYNHEKLIGSNHRLLNSGTHPTSFFIEMYKTISNGLVWHGVICNRNQNGELYWVETTITPYKDDNGVVQQYIAIRTDVSKQKAFEQQQQIGLKIAAIKLAISSSFSRENSLQKQLSEGLLHLFELPKFNLIPKGCIYTLNNENQSFELIAKQGLFSIHQLADEEKLLALCQQSLHSNGLIVNTFYSEKGGEEHGEHGHFIMPLTSELDGLETGNNNLVGFILLFTEENSVLDDEQVQLSVEGAAIFTNAILRDKANKLLKSATETALQNSQLKGDFLASMSHEIRTPMNGVLGMLGLLLNSDLNKDQKHKAKIAKSSAESLLVLINDILDFSKVEAGKMELDIIDFNLREMLGELSEAMALRAQEKGVEIILDVTAIDDSMVKGDPGRLRQITTNLISNAIKFTERGEIKITAWLDKKEEGQLLLQCDVEDSGIGIPDGKISDLFDTFTQVDASTTRKDGGTGLGLAICKKLSQLMGGDVTATSQLGKGSTFSFSANLKTSQQSQRVLPRIDISKLNLLIVDDNFTNLEVLRGQLEHWGASVTEATSGKQALQLCYERWSSSESNFDVALLDMQMPEMDGAELGKTLRADSRFDEMKLVMMTSISIQNEPGFFAKLGFNAYFPKPATTSDLFKALSVVVDNGDTLREAVPLVTHDYLASLAQKRVLVEASVFDKSSVKILLVEDNKVNQMVALGILQEFGFSADIAENGEQAIDILNNSSKEKPYDVIYMDCQMPVMDGYQTTYNIRHGDAGDHYKSIPIIAMTANAMEGDREKCLQSGMDDYIGKPIDPSLLESKLYQWLALDVEKLGIVAPSLIADKKASISSEGDLICWHQAEALQRLVNKESLLISLINTFIEEIPSKIEQLSDAVKQSDDKEIALLAHTIKGASANLSGLKLSYYCAQLEALAKSDDKMLAEQAYVNLFDDLSLSYHELKDEFNHYIVDTMEQSLSEESLSIEQALAFLCALNLRLAESDYIESEELNPLIESTFGNQINEWLKELQQMIMLFDLTNAQQLTEKIIFQLEQINKGNS
jgi:two-component system sensor histidine kinase/response regulator